MKKIRTFSLFAFTFSFTLAASAITATKAYVDIATNATLTEAKHYTDTVAGIDAATATKIAGRVTSNVVTKAYVEGLGIGGGMPDRITNALNVITADGKWLTNTVQNGWQTNYLCTVAAANETYLGKHETAEKASILETEMGIGSRNANISYDLGYGSWVITDLYRTNEIIAAKSEIPDAYTKNDADAKFLDKNSTNEQTVAGNLLVGGGKLTVSGDGGETAYINFNSEDSCINYVGGFGLFFSFPEGAFAFGNSILFSDDSYVMTEKMTEAKFAENADYALTNLAANAASVSLASGTIANLVTTGGPLNVSLVLPANVWRSCDAMLRVVNEADIALGISMANVELDGAWPYTIKAGTNLVMFVKTAYNAASSKSVITVTSKEVK